MVLEDSLRASKPKELNNVDGTECNGRHLTFPEQASDGLFQSQRLGRRKELPSPWMGHLRSRCNMM